ncbi:MAG: hypothetical protein IME99_07695 [Proteobacteria bacterium]|nr:hypothetical protein [Pseudomonadota bacterium]
MKSFKQLAVLTVLLALPVLLGACTKSASCDSPKVESQVLDRMKAGFERQFTQTMGNADALKKLSFSLRNVVQTGLDDKSHTYSCTADVALTGPNETKTMPITYTAAMTPGGLRVQVDRF